MKEYLVGVGIGACLMMALMRIYQNRRPSRTRRDNGHARQRPRQENMIVRERQDQIEQLENQFFLGMQIKLNLSEEQIRALKNYLHVCFVDNQELLDNAPQLCEILKAMKRIKLIEPNSYGRISHILQNARIDPAPIAVNITRLRDAVADARAGVQQRDYGADMFEYDGVIIHCEDDRDAVSNFITNITALLDVPDLSSCSVEDYQAARPRIGGLSMIFAETRYVFVFVTENLREDELNRYMTEVALTETLIDPVKKFRIIPIWTSNERIRFAELQPLPGIRYWRYFNGDRDREQLGENFRRHIINGRYNIQQVA